MGQRFQTVFILPEVFMNEGNPNNRGKRILTFHNQWLFGWSALNVNLHILKRLKRAIRSRKTTYSHYGKTIRGFINHYLEDEVKSAVKYAPLAEYPTCSEFHEPQEDEFKNWGQLGVVMSEQDNNNGYFIVHIDEELKIRYMFVSGFEDEDIIDLKTPLHYLRLFYSEDVMRQWDKRTNKKLMKLLFEYGQFLCIPPPDLVDTLRVLNVNKPTWAEA